MDYNYISLYNTASVRENKNYAGTISSSNFAAGIAGNVQCTENPTDIDWQVSGIAVGQNLSATALEGIDAPLRNLFVYTNGNTVTGENTVE